MEIKRWDILPMGLLLKCSGRQTGWFQVSYLILISFSIPGIHMFTILLEKAQ